MPTSASRPCLGPALVLGELRVAELHARELVRPLGVRGRQRHRHVEVGAAGLEGGREDRRVEARVAGVQERVGAGVSRAGRRPRPRRSASTCAAPKRSGSPEPRDERLGPRRVDVGEDDPLEERRGAARSGRPPRRRRPCPTTRIRMRRTLAFPACDELNRAEIDELLHGEFIGRIGCHADGETYVVPGDLRVRRRGGLRLLGRGPQDPDDARRPRGLLRGRPLRRARRLAQRDRGGRYEELDGRRRRPGADAAPGAVRGEGPRAAAGRGRRRSRSRSASCIGEVTGRRKRPA